MADHVAALNRRDDQHMRLLRQQCRRRLARVERQLAVAPRPRAATLPICRTRPPLSFLIGQTTPKASPFCSAVPSIPSLRRENVLPPLQTPRPKL